MKSLSTSDTQIKGVGLATPVPTTVTSDSSTVDVRTYDPCLADLESYLQFIIMVFYLWSVVKVEVPMLRDTGAFDYFIQAGLLLSSEESESSSFRGSWL